MHQAHDQESFEKKRRLEKQWALGDSQNRPYALWDSPYESFEQEFSTLCPLSEEIVNHEFVNEIPNIVELGGPGDNLRDSFIRPVNYSAGVTVYDFKTDAEKASTRDSRHQVIERSVWDYGLYPDLYRRFQPLGGIDIIMSRMRAGVPEYKQEPSLHVRLKILDEAYRILNGKGLIYMEGLKWFDKHDDRDRTIPDFIGRLRSASSKHLQMDGAIFKGDHDLARFLLIRVAKNDRAPKHLPLRQLLPS